MPNKAKNLRKTTSALDFQATKYLVVVLSWEKYDGFAVCYYEIL